LHALIGLLLKDIKIINIKERCLFSDALATVSCTFEHQFMCGNEFVQHTAYKWGMNSGPTQTATTGNLWSTRVPDPEQLLRRALMVHVISKVKSTLKKQMKNEFCLKKLQNMHVLIYVSRLIEIVNVVDRNNCKQYCC
jgi:hypothetical protein